MSDVRRVPEEAYVEARRAYDRATGDLLHFHGPAVQAAVDAAAKPIQNAVLREFVTVRQGCLFTIVAVLAIAVDFALYVGIALYVDGLLRWLAVAAFTLTVAIQVFTRLWKRRVSRRANALLDELEQPGLS